ncbi:UNVERIFIED_CONTAM: Zinc finger protein AZF2 [Sesamum radiatum]|uniref:Zinc finger protein AZF2 n=1 Tax=Sesamum radiatum TaxID=300843 RepID=A0AAW2U7R8_SESRA
MSVVPTPPALVPSTQRRLRRRCRRFVHVDQPLSVGSWPTAKRCKIMDNCTSEEEEIVAECLLMLARSGGAFCVPSSSFEALTPPAPDEYVADCLVMLASSGGDGSPSGDPTTGPAADDSEKQTEVVSASPVLHSSVKDNGYKCDFCDKAFPSYQALGGHKTSHRSKPPTAAATATVETSKYTVGTKYSSGGLTLAPSAPRLFRPAKPWAATSASITRA